MPSHLVHHDIHLDTLLRLASQHLPQRPPATHPSARHELPHATNKGGSSGDHTYLLSSPVWRRNTRSGHTHHPAIRISSLAASNAVAMAAKHGMPSTRNRALHPSRTGANEPRGCGFVQGSARGVVSADTNASAIWWRHQQPTSVSHLGNGRVRTNLRTYRGLWRAHVKPARGCADDKLFGVDGPLVEGRHRRKTS